ncbi:hypothetical protein GCM10017044_02800 [Kordiimonas sediminis]|uniref:Phospholipid/glycerol acyltransferase domain-containing protein n=1 Tax=Kordiimonas sediminis TaxID=1735581 RepID=A0A919AK00_9PROT|nr:lysophospholipid acyltransferase family protein [Kordiimonas sediminis]GHF12306.1 hypothetical protein GCM10017044_02800 [Kordiimonas sediminis]
MGIRYEFRNADQLPKTGGIILAAAHQSYMDPFLAYQLRQDVTALAKKELFQIPMIGPLLKKIGVVRVDRQAGRSSKGMEDVAKRVKEEGKVLIVYPQATRVPIGESRKLKPGAFFLQKFGDMDVYPVATSTGVFWTKGFWHRPGTAVYAIGEPITNRPEKEAFMKHLQREVVDKSDDLVREAGYAALLDRR